MTQAGQINFSFGTDSVPMQEWRKQVNVPSGISTKEHLLTALDVGLGFPEYFGENWDALWDCICDLTWLEPVQIVLIHEDLPLRADPKLLKTYLEILRDAVAHWKARMEHDLIVVFPSEYEETVRSLMT